MKIYLTLYLFISITKIGYSQFNKSPFTYSAIGEYQSANFNTSFVVGDIYIVSDIKTEANLSATVSEKELTQCSEKDMWYPNPSQGYVKIEINDNGYDLISTRVYNTSGALVYTVENSTSTNIYAIDLSTIKNGLYIIETILFKNGHVTKKINHKIILNTY